MNLLLGSLLCVVTFNALFCAENIKNEKVVNPLDYVTNSADIQKIIAGYAAEPLDCVTHIAGIQKIIADYCDQEWVLLDAFAKKDIQAFACSPDGRYMAYILGKSRGNWVKEGVDSGADSKQANVGIEIWDTIGKKTAKSVIQFGAEDVPQLVFSPDSKYLAVARGRIWFIDVNTMRCMALQENSGWPLPSNSREESFVEDSNIRAVAFSPCGNYLASLDENTSVTRIGKDGSCCRYQHAYDIPVKKIAFSADGSKAIAFAESDFRLLIFDFKTTTVTEYVLQHVILAREGLAILPKDCIAAPAMSAVPATGSEEIAIVNYLTDKEIFYDLEFGERVKVPLITINAKYLACVNKDGKIIIYNIFSYQEKVKEGGTMPADCVNVIEDTGKDIKSLHCSTDSKYLTAEHNNGLIKRWVNLSHYLLEKYKSKD